MTQQNAVEFVERSIRRAERNFQELQATLEQLQDADDDTAAAIMAGEHSRALKFHEEEVDSHQARSGSASLPRIETHLNHEGSPPEAHQRRGSLSEALTAGLTPNSKSNMEARLKAMGAIPALGGLMRANPNARSALQPTNSLAARELSHRHSSSGRNGSSSGFGDASASPPREADCPPWQGEVRLRQLNSIPARAAVPQTDHVNDELSAMFAKRQALK